MTAYITVTVVEPNGNESQTEMEARHGEELVEMIESAEEIMRDAKKNGWVVWFEATLENKYTDTYTEQEVEEVSSLMKWYKENWRG